MILDHIRRKSDIMLKDNRLKEIEEMLHQYGKVEVSSLCRIFNVTEMTIRRDLNELERRNLAIRSHGGAILPDNILSERPYELRMTHNLQEKDAIAKEALPLIEDGCTVFFDSSTTVYYLARLITNSHNFLVVTDTITTALELNSRANVKVICLGGELKKTTHSCSGLFAEQMLESMHFNIAFIGVPSISYDGILSTSSISELSIKQTVMKHSSSTVILADSSKLGSSDFLKFGHISECDTIITDSNIPREFVDYCTNQGVRVIIAKL